MGLDGKSSQEYSVNALVRQGSRIALFLQYFNIFPGDFVYDMLSTVMIPLSILSMIRHLICGDN